MITIATYNILHGYHTKFILSTIKALIEKGTTVICLQEAEVSFEKILNEFLQVQKLDSWKAYYVHFGPGGNLAFIWDGATLELQDIQTVLLPVIAPVFMQRIKNHNTALQRVAMVARFAINGQSIRITNVHLAWEGGNRHRLKQLKYLKEHLNTFKINTDIIAGDFNTFLPQYFYKIQQHKIESLLGKEYINILPNLTWTCDITYTAPQDKWETIAKICKMLKVKLRSKLDYIFVRNAIIVSTEMLDLPGSDHRPLIATFQI